MTGRSSRHRYVLALALAASVAGCGGQPTTAPAEGHRAAAARGREHLRRGRPDLALRAVESVRDERPGAGEAMAVAGQALLQLGQWRGARLALERAVRLEPDQPEALQLLATMAQRSGDVARAVEHLKQLARVTPDDPRPWLAMGRIYHDTARQAEAADAFEQALKIRPDDPDATAALIAERLGGDQAEQATPWLERARRRRPGDSKLLGLAARHALALGRADDAIRLAGDALGRDPDNLDALLARARIAANDPDKALPDLRRAVAIRPNDLGALLALAQVEARLGLKDEAEATAARHRRELERAEAMARITDELARRPDDPGPRVAMGRLAAEGGSTALAAECFRAALALDPAYRPARDALAQLRTAPESPSASALP